MSDRLQELAIILADSVARADVETMCTYQPAEASLDADATHFWCDVSSVTNPDDHAAVTVALEYLELRGMLRRHPTNPSWLRVIDAPEGVTK